jgi:putative heme-binding domain-containing protein
MLRPDHPVLTLDRLRRFITYSGEPAVAIEAVRSLSRSPLPDRFKVLSSLATDPKAPILLRAEAIVGLSDHAVDNRDALLSLAISDQPVLRHEALRALRGVPLDEAAVHRLKAACSSDESALELLNTLEQNGAKRPAHAAPNDLDGWLARLEGPADRAAGERVFFHPKGPGCYQCHQVSGRGGRTGPDLSSVAGGMDRRRLVESIVAPSKEIAPQFVAWTVATTDGKVFTGILLEQTPYGTFVFADTRGQPIELKSESIAERKQATVSIMPDNMAQTMTRQEFRDLLAFLLGR